MGTAQLLAEATDPTAALYGVLATALVSGTLLAFRFFPRTIKNGKGERLVTKEAFEEFKKEIGEDFKAEKDYRHKFVHDIRDNFMQSQTLKLALLEQQVKTLELRIEDSDTLGGKLDDMRAEQKSSSDRQCALLEAALKRTYGHGSSI